MRSKGSLPASAIWSMSPAHVVPTVARRLSTRRGVKAFETSPRSRVWSGGSMNSRLCVRTSDSSLMPISVVARVSLLDSTGLRSIAATSGCDRQNQMVSAARINGSAPRYAS